MDLKKLSLVWCNSLDKLLLLLAPIFVTAESSESHYVSGMDHSKGWNKAYVGDILLNCCPSTHNSL
jgi:hypothetical protein